MYYLCKIEYTPNQDDIIIEDKIEIEANNLKEMVEEAKKFAEKKEIILLFMELLRLTNDKKISFDWWY